MLRVEQLTSSVEREVVAAKEGALEQAALHQLAMEEARRACALEVAAMERKLQVCCGAHFKLHDRVGVHAIRMICQLLFGGTHPARTARQ
jgi:hypothetical protein